MGKKKVEAEEPKTIVQPKVETPLDRTKVYVDWNRRTCLALRMTDDACTFIPLNIEGLDVQTWSRKKFEENYDELFDYPVLRASRVFIDLAQKHGATPEVMDEIRLLTAVTEKEYIMATTKKAAAAAKLATTKPKAAKAPKAAAAEVKAPKTPKAAAEVKAPKTQKEPAAPRETAASMFRELIVEGKLNDDQIFAKVQAKFGLSDDKRSYVNWNRSKLVREGVIKAQPKMDMPVEKAGHKAAKPATKPATKAEAKKAPTGKKK
jgi:hypothetical protein